jgi:hypothetical protein
MVFGGLENLRIEPDREFCDLVPERGVRIGDQRIIRTMRSDLTEQARLGNDLEHVLGLWLVELGAGVCGFDHQTVVAAEVSDAEWVEDTRGQVDQQAIRRGA